MSFTDEDLVRLRKVFPPGGITPEELANKLRTPSTDASMNKLAEAYHELYEILKANPDKYLKITSGNTKDTDE